MTVLRRRAFLVVALALLVTSATGTAGAMGAAAMGREAAAPHLLPSVEGGPRAAREVVLLPVVAPAQATPLRSRPSSPIDVPRDSYAPEPIVKLGRIQVPRLGVDAVLYDGVTLNNIDNGPSHWPGSAMPGQVGNVVVAGHRVTHSHPFRDIHTMVAGDEVIFTVDGFRSVYAMVRPEIVTPSGTHIVDQGATATATLFACHPPRSAKYRYVVHMVLVESLPVPA